MPTKNDKDVKHRWSVFKSVKKNKNNFLMFLTIDKREDMCIIYHFAKKSNEVNVLWCNYEQLKNNQTYNTSSMETVHKSIVKDILGFHIQDKDVFVPAIDKYRFYIKNAELGPEIWFLRNNENIRVFNVHLSGFSILPPSVGYITLNGYRITEEGKKQIVSEQLPLSNHVKSMDLISITNMYKKMR